jgi:hypothetical protein
VLLSLWFITGEFGVGRLLDLLLFELFGAETFVDQLLVIGGTIVVEDVQRQP